MKKINSLVVLCALSLLASCGKENEGGGGDTPETPNIGTQADIVSFTLINGDVRIDATVSSFEKRVLIVYLPEQASALSGATAEVTLSEGAKITPDPAQTLDYNDEQVFVVTSEDGTLTKNYIVSAQEASVVTQVEKLWTKSYTNLGVSHDEIFDQGQSQIGFCAKDKFVVHTGEVYDLEGNKLGNLNTAGIPSEWGLISLANDEDANFIATFGNSADASNMVDLNNEGAIYIWPEGYAGAPVQLYRFSSDNIPSYPSYSAGHCDCAGLSAAGSWGGNLVVCTQHFHDVSIDETSAELFGITPCDHTTLHNVLYFTDGKLKEFKVFDSRKQLGGNWIQMVSPVSASPESSFVIGNSQQTGSGYSVWVRKSFSDLSNDSNLLGLGSEVQDPEVSYDGIYGYGNYSVGHVKAFNWFGVDAVIVISTYWEGSYMTVQPLDSDAEYIQKTMIVSNIGSNRSSCAYYFDGDKGHILLNVGFNGGEVSLYEIYRVSL